MEVTFDSPQRPCAPGQSLVLYDGDTVLGGGTISDAPGSDAPGSKAVSRGTDGAAEGPSEAGL